MTLSYLVMMNCDDTDVQEAESSEHKHRAKVGSLAGSRLHQTIGQWRTQSSTQIFNPSMPYPFGI